MLVNDLQPIALASQVMTDLAVALRARSEVSRASRSMFCSPYGGFDIQWDVSAYYDDDEECRTWMLRLYWKEDAWIIERAVSQAVEGGDEPVIEFDDIVVNDAELASALVEAASSLVAVDLHEGGLPDS